MRAVRAGAELKLLCECCDLPIARTHRGRLVIASRHHRETHTNALTADELQQLAAFLERAQGAQAEDLIQRVRLD
ncbi:MAG TPA: hypothetical protein VNJ09_00630 [Chthonomonadales bacterium]|jgi:hypothetical protein|nr:hypothetical protein [Chthonomonadales bacterium]